MRESAVRISPSVLVGPCPVVTTSAEGAPECGGGPRLRRRSGLVPHLVTEDSGSLYLDPDEEQVITCEMEPGDVSIHLPLTVHRSTPNESDEMRRTPDKLASLRDNLSNRRGAEETRPLVREGFGERKSHVRPPQIRN